MSRGDARFAAAAASLGAVIEVETFPEGTRTAGDAARAVGCEVAQIVKSLVFMTDGGSPVLALTSGKNRADPKLLAAAVSTESIRQATADEVRHATGYAIGGTPPFGHETPIETLVDEDLMTFERVWAAAGTPNTCFAIAPQELLRLSRGTMAAFAERGT